jgi:peptide/nickel transport system ATP-binding protein
MNENNVAIKNEQPKEIIKPSQEIVLKVENLKVYFPSKKNMFGKVTEYYKAVDDVSFNIYKNETVGLVGESGCGKTTLGRAILNLVKPTSGNIFFGGKDIAKATPEEMRLLRKELQIVFQDPYGSLNPRLSIGDAIVEPMNVHGLSSSTNARKEKAIHLLEQVNMPADVFNRYPHQFSGGQRQRICIARALALNPNFLIFDESVSALDVSVQAQVLNLINDLKVEYNFTSIFISHNLSVIHYISDRIMVMNKGKIIESGTADEIIFSPKENYTKELLAAVPGAIQY